MAALRRQVRATPASPSSKPWRRSTILALITGLGVPAFGKYLRWYRLQSEAQALVWALQFARSEAIKRNTRVNVCKSADRIYVQQRSGASRRAGSSMPIPAASGNPTRTTRRIRIEPAAPDGITIHGNKPVADLVSYTAYGHPRLLGGGLQMGTFTLCRPGVDADPRGARQQRPRAHRKYRRSVLKNRS